MDFAHFLLRYLHTFAAIIWIGHLYYLNFVQGAYMNDIEAPMKTAAQIKLFPRVMWWFRYGALWTFILGVCLLTLKGHQSGFVAASSYWVNILTGALLGTCMAANVWFIIWPRQKQIIANAGKVAKGETAIPGIAAMAARSGVASRTNVFLSIPMLFFMNGAMHWSYGVKEDMVPVYWIITFIIVAAIEFNALKGKLGPLTTVKGVLTCGFGLLAVFFAVIMGLLQA